MVIDAADESVRLSIITNDTPSAEDSTVPSGDDSTVPLVPPSASRRAQLWHDCYEGGAIYCVLTAIACIIAGWVEYKYGRSHLFTPAAVEQLRQDAQTACTRQPCIGNCTALNANLVTHLHDDGFILYQCYRGCTGSTTCPDVLAFQCYQECQATWNYVKDADDHTATDGERATVIGVVLLVVGGGAIFLACVLCHKCEHQGLQEHRQRSAQRERQVQQRRDNQRIMEAGSAT